MKLGRESPPASTPAEASSRSRSPIDSRQQALDSSPLVTGLGFQPSFFPLSSVVAAQEVDAVEPGEAAEESATSGGEEIEEGEQEEVGEGGFDPEGDEEGGAAVDTSASDIGVNTSTAGFGADWPTASSLPSSSNLQDKVDLPPSLSELQTLSPSLDDGIGVARAKDPLQPIEEVLNLCFEGPRVLLCVPEKCQRLEEIFSFLKSSSYCSSLTLREERLIFFLSPRLPSILSLQSNILKELEAVGAYFRAVESYRASATSRELPTGEHREQLFQLRQRSAEIEKEIVETESLLASLRRDLATSQAATSAAEAQFRSEADLNFHRDLYDLLSKHLEMKQRRKKAHPTQEMLDAEWKQL